MSRLLILGASGRAAAVSARRAGFEPFVIDLFADADTQRIATTLKLPIEQYPQGFAESAKRFPPMPWIYTGGLENAPEVVATISTTRELWGNDPRVLKKTRDPFWIHRTLEAHGLEHAQPFESVANYHDRTWLKKPIKSAAGFQIDFATDAELIARNPLFHLQEFIPGQAMSVVVRSAGGRLVVLDATRQLIGIDWLHAPKFRYCGSITGIPQCEQILSATIRHAEVLTNDAQLEGIWGFDFIWNRDRPYLIEINPRYPASAELIELATGCSVFSSQPAGHPHAVGKGIYFAPHRITIPPSTPWEESLLTCNDVWKRHDYADLPHAGETIDPGDPVCTIFAEGANEEQVEARLRSRASELDRFFEANSSR